jgi:branched-chain amino acid aminotransferase/para-aminobenzoate synthetase component 1
MADRVVWLNEGFLSSELARISPLDRGMLYGDGLFETMRAQEGKALRLPLYVARLQRGLAFLRISAGGLTEAELAPVIGALLMKNGLARRSASVKIVVSRGEAAGHGLPVATRPTVLVLADAYDPPPSSTYREGWRLSVTPSDGAGTIGGYKTLSYLRLLAARQAAVDAGADEALLVDGEGGVVETAAGSILALTRDGWVSPEHPAQLAGITVQTVAGFLERKGNAVRRRRVLLSELEAAKAVWVLGSLAGIMPVRSIGAVRITETHSELAEELRGELFGSSGD